MPQDLNNMLSTIQEMLSSEDGRKNIENIVGTFMSSGGDSPEPEPSGGDAPEQSGEPKSELGLGSLFGNINIAEIMRIMGSINSVSKDDPGVRLLHALRPFLQDEKASHLDDAVKILMLSKIPFAMQKDGGGERGA